MVTEIIPKFLTLETIGQRSHNKILKIVQVVTSAEVETGDVGIAEALTRDMKLQHNL